MFLKCAEKTFYTTLLSRTKVVEQTHIETSNQTLKKNPWNWTIMLCYSILQIGSVTSYISKSVERMFGESIGLVQIFQCIA